MKLLTVLILMMSGAKGYATAFTTDFAISCKGKLKLEVISSSFEPAEICSDIAPTRKGIDFSNYCGRRLPNPASGFVKVHATVVDTNNFYCHAFEDKVGVSLYNYSFTTSFHAYKPSLDVVEKLEKDLDGAIVPFKIDQSFAFNVGTLLPMYPHILEETISFKTKLKDIGSMAHYIKIDSQKAYGLPRVVEADDQTKLNAVDKILEFNIERELNAPKKSSAVYFMSLITKLEPFSASAKITYAKKLVDFIDFVASKKYKPSFFFEINVGGSAGTAIAEKLYQLDLDESLVQHVISKYPHFILGTSVVATNVFKNMNSAMLEEAMQGYIDVATKDEKLSFGEKGMLKNAQKVAKAVLKPNSFNVFGRNPELVSKELISLSEELLMILK